VNVKNSRLWSRLLSNWHQKVIALIASLFVFVFYRISTQREIRVSLEIKRPAGYELARDWPPDVTIVARGNTAARSFSEKDFRAVADLTAFTEGGLVKGAVHVDFLRGKDPDTGLEFDFSPSIIEFYLEPVLDKYVPVDAKTAVTGVLPPRYFLESLSFTPQNVLVRGPKSYVEKTTKVAVENFDLTGKRTTLSGSVKILTGSRFVRTVDASEVKITAVIKGRKIFENVIVVFDGLRSDLTTRDEVRGTVELEGTDRALENLKSEDLALSVDCRDVGPPGEYTLVLHPPELPSPLQGELKIASVTPDGVTVRFERKAREE
jgi:YbbR domain-containing protein